MAHLRSILKVYCIFVVVVIGEVIGEEYLCDKCQCYEGEVKCDSLENFHLLNAFNATNVKRLVITGSDLGNVDNEFFSKFQNASSVVINSSNMTVNTSALSLLTELKTLNLDNTLIQTIPTGMFETNTRLLDLSLNNVGMKYLTSDMFKNLKDLTALSIANNSVEELNTGVFDGLSSLKELDLSANRIARIEAGAFSPLSALRALNLSGNLLEELEEGALRGLSSLEELDLSGNGLLRVPAPASALAQLPRLRALRLRADRIASLGPALAQWLAQRPDRSAQLDGVRCACGELRDAWEAASARGVLARLRVACADTGAPWGDAIRGLGCSPTDPDATRTTPEQEHPSATEERDTEKATSTSSNDIHQPQDAETRSAENPVAVPDSLKKASVAETGARFQKTSDSANPSDRKSSKPGPVLSPAVALALAGGAEKAKVLPGSENSAEGGAGLPNSLSPAQYIALAEGVEIGGVLLETAQRDSKKREWSPAQKVAYAEGVEMVQAVVQGVHEMQPSMNELWRATLEAESSWKQMNKPVFEESRRNAAVMTSIVCVSIIACISGFAAGTLLYMKLARNEVAVKPEKMYELATFDSECPPCSVEKYVLSYKFTDVESETEA